MTAIPPEYQAVRSHLSDLEELTHPEGTVYERGKFACPDGEYWSVAIVEIGAGNTGAALETERAIAYFRPKVLLFIGVAGGIKDVTLGDVVAATKVYGYESGKAKAPFLARPNVGESSYSLIQRARAEAKKDAWLRRLAPKPDGRTPRSFVGPIAAGEKVIASNRSDVYRFLRKAYSDAVAIEMEGRGFLDAAHANQRVSALIVRGISDLLDHKDHADAAGFQQTAAFAASAFAFEVLANWKRPASRKRSPSSRPSTIDEANVARSVATNPFPPTPTPVPTPTTQHVGATTKRFRVAFSFAGEKRAYVARVAGILARRFGKAAILYDKYHQAEFARDDLGFYLPDLYHDQSDLIVVVLCADYERKEWCGLEWRAIFDLLKKHRHADVMLCRFDRATAQGLYSTAGFVDLDDQTSAQTASRILERLTIIERHRKELDPPEQDTPAIGQPPRIPRELPPAASQFFGRKSERKQLADRLREGFNTAVVGPAGLGKTALAAAALADVVGKDAVHLSASHFSDGIIYLDLYELHGQAEKAWDALANRLCGLQFHEGRLARERAAEACRARRLLVIIEAGEEADGGDGRPKMKVLLSVLSPENRWLLLTRRSDQAKVEETVQLKEALATDDAAALLDALTEHRRLDPHVRQTVLELLEGHPLALNWTGNILARDEEDPSRLVDEWKAGRLPKLTDPTEAEHTLKWLFERSVRGLDDTAQRALNTAGLLAHAPFPLGPVVAALTDADTARTDAEPARVAVRTLVRRGLLRHVADSWQFTHVLGYRFARDEEHCDRDVLKRMGEWLNEHIREALWSRDVGGAIRSLSFLLQHVAAVLRAVSDPDLWESLAKTLLYGALDRLKEIGQLDAANQLFYDVAEWLRIRADRKVGQPYWRNEYRRLLETRADGLYIQNDQRGAVATYRESLSVQGRAAESDLANAAFQQELAAKHQSIGDVARARGDVPGAYAEYTESLAIRTRLAGSDPSNALWQRELGVSLTKVGDILRVQDDLSGALVAYRRSLAIRERLVESDPSNPVWQGDLSATQKRIGDVLLAKGDWDGALAQYGQSLAIIRRLAESDIANADWQRDLSLALTALAKYHEARKEFIAALPFAVESLAIDERLAALDPTAIRDVTFSRALVAQLRAQTR